MTNSRMANSVHAVPGLFITLEGGEGVGKSTNLAVIAEILTEHQIEHISTREPGGTDLAERIRALLLETHEESMQPMTELLLVFAARAQHIETVIKPALARGQWILCDRFTDATYAYQGAGRGMNTGLIQQLETIVQQELRPDLTILLDIDPEVGMQRAQQRGELDRFELESIDFFNTVRSAYLQRAVEDPLRFRVVDASQSISDVKQELVSVLKTAIGRERG